MNPSLLPGSERWNERGNWLGYILAASGLLWLVSVEGSLAQSMVSTAPGTSAAVRDQVVNNAMVPNHSRASLAGTGASAGNQISEKRSHNARLGQIYLNFSPTFEVEFNSNVYFSSINPIADIILRPGILVSFDWAITQKNQLKFNLGLDYAKYLRALDRDSNGFRLAPDTVLSYSLFVGDFVITAYDRPSIEQDPGNDPSLTNTAPYTLLSNTAGLTVVWDLNKLILSGLLERQDTQTLNGNFNDLNRVTYLAQLSAIYLFTPTFSGGPFAAVSYTSYPGNALNNSTTTQLGVSTNHALTLYTTLNFSGGLQVMDFQNNGNQQPGFSVNSAGYVDNVTGTGGGGNFIGPFASFSVTNRLNRYLSHSLRLEFLPLASSVSNYTLITGIIYDLSWRMNRQVSCNFGTNFENGQVSGTSPSYRRLEFRAGLNGQLTQNISWKMELGQIFQSQTQGEGNILQTRCVVGVDYAF